VRHLASAQAIRGDKLLKTTNAPAVAPLQNTRLEKNPLSGLRSPGLLGKWPLIGLMMILLGCGLFGVMAVNLQTHGPLIQTDLQIVNNLHDVALHSSPFLLGVMIFGFYLGEHGIVAIGAVLVLYFLYKRFWPELGMVLIAWGGEGGIWTVLSQYFNRARPMFDISVWRQMPSAGFPSGHSFSAVLCFGLLAYLLVPKMASRFGKTVVIAAALLIILFIGFSRVFVGDHYPTDILAGYALGIAWAGLVYTTVELLALRRRRAATSQDRKIAFAQNA
jgi:undecaprenyl-diphosphatase